MPPNGARPGPAFGEQDSKNRPPGRRPAYDAVTAFFTCKEEPFRVRRVRALRESHFPGTGEPAVQVIESSWASVPDRDLGDAGQVLKARAEGLFEMHLILLRPEKIDYFAFERRGERWEASLEQALGES